MVFIPGPPAPPARGRLRRPKAFASSARTPYPSLPPGGESSLIPSRLLSPRGPQGSLRRPQWATGGGGSLFTPGCPILPARGRLRRRWASASSARTPYPSLPPGGESSLISSRLLSPRGQQGSPWGPQWATGGGGGLFTPGFPIPPARGRLRRRWASASRPAGTGPRSPPWVRRPGRSA